MMNTISARKRQMSKRARFVGYPRYVNHTLKGTLIPEDLQALFMQARIVRLASHRWRIPLADAAMTLYESGALAHVGDCFDYFHLEGDKAVLDDVEEYLTCRGIDVNALT